jgi:hypothetical protein
MPINCWKGDRHCECCAAEGGRDRNTHRDVGEFVSKSKKKGQWIAEGRNASFSQVRRLCLSKVMC